MAGVVLDGAEAVNFVGFGIPAHNGFGSHPELAVGAHSDVFHLAFRDQIVERHGQPAVAAVHLPDLPFSGHPDAVGAFGAAMNGEIFLLQRPASFAADQYALCGAHPFAAFFINKNVEDFIGSELGIGGIERLYFAQSGLCFQQVQAGVGGAYPEFVAGRAISGGADGVGVVEDVAQCCVHVGSRPLEVKIPARKGVERLLSGSQGKWIGQIGGAQLEHALAVGHPFHIVVVHKNVRDRAALVYHGDAGDDEAFLFLSEDRYGKKCKNEDQHFVQRVGKFHCRDALKLKMQ